MLAMNKLLSAAALLTVFGLATIAPSSADEVPDVEADSARSVDPPPDLRASDLNNQQLLDEIVQPVYELVEDGAKGFAKIRNDILQLHTTIYWKGQPPKEVQQLEGTRPNGVEVLIVRSRFSQDDVARASARVVQASQARVMPPVERVQANQDFSGLLVGFTQDRIRGVDKVRTRASVAEVTGMPTEIMEVPELVPASRQNDIAPWRGGAQIRLGSSFCSTGFAVSVPSTGEGRILSAGHCNPSGGGAWSDGIGQQFTLGGGDVRVDLRPLDTMLINPVGETVGAVYGGPWNAPTSHGRYRLNVATASTSSEGDTLCVSGAMSGERCNLFVDQANVFNTCPNDPPGREQCRYDIALSVFDIAAIAQGDSGGPAYTNRSDGRISARNIISGAFTGSEVSCPSTAAETVCYTMAALVPIRPILEFWDRDLKKFG